MWVIESLTGRLPNSSNIRAFFRAIRRPIARACRCRPRCHAQPPHLRPHSFPIQGSNLREATPQHPVTIKVRQCALSPDCRAADQLDTTIRTAFLPGIKHGICHRFTPNDQLMPSCIADHAHDREVGGSCRLPLAPGTSVSSTIRVLWSRDQRRRRSKPPNTSTRIA